MNIRLRQLFLTLAAIMLLSTAAAAQNDLKSPEQYLGYGPGNQWTPHHKVFSYFKHVAESSPMVHWQQYGTTYEGRKLLYVTVSAKENIERTEEIRTNNLNRAGLLDGAPTGDTTAIVWLSYNVHGNEPSSSEAAMKTLYELVRPGNHDTKKWLQNTMVIMDPMLNPDGRERYVHWYKETAGDEVNPHIDAREHHEPWPGGRTNHYYFDLNRDWAWLTQKESRQRNEVFQKWLPHIHVDFHEQDYNSPYYFAPAADPFHEAITAWQQQFQYTIGENHAGYFDANNWLYFTREVFDLFYPSYGDTYPIFNGSIGMTYEQAGHSRAGLGVIQTGGDTLTLKDRLTHHLTTGLSTVEVASRHAAQVIEKFTTYYQDARENPDGRYKTFVINGDNNPDKLRSLFELLDRHNVEYGKVPRAQTYPGYNYSSGKDEQIELSTDDYIVSTYQPKSVLARIFFEPHPELTDSLTYDITAWEQHYAFGLEGAALAERVNPVPADPPPNTVDSSFQGTPYAYLAEWSTMADMKLLSALLNKGAKIRFASEQFTVDGTAYPPGTLIVTRNDNTHMGDRFDQIVQETARSLGQQLNPVSSGLVDSGPDLGSDAVHFMEKPTVALFSGKGTSANNVGEIWHFFDKQIDYPVTLLDADYFRDVDLDRYDLLILPEGSYGETISNSRLDEIREWITEGGRLIALQKANAFLADKNEFSLKPKKDGEEDKDLSVDQTSFDQRRRKNISESNSGSVFRISIDATHPLGYGYGSSYFSLKLDADAYHYLEQGWNVGIAKEEAHTSGFVGHKAEEKLENTLTFGVQQMGQGRVVYMIDNPLFRGFWHNGKLLFGNAVFMVGQ